MKDSAAQHFRQDEQSFVDMCFDWVRQVEQQYVPYLTSFLNPRERYILQSIVGQNESCLLAFDGGFDGAERKRALLYPPYTDPQQEDMDLALCEIHYAVKFNTLTHGQILGTLLGSGIKRETIGDIITDGEKWQFYTQQAIADVLSLQTDRIGRVPVTIACISPEKRVEPLDEWQTKTVISSSMRLDKVAGAVFNVSRQKSKELIEAKKIKVNWVEELRPSFELEVQDMVSVRQKGRFRIEAVNGYTKKDNIVLEIGVLARKK